MKITIILPCYNSGNIISSKIETFKKYLNSLSRYNFNIIIVNDGSTDDSFNVLKKIKGIRLLSYKINKGKGGAIKYALNNLEFCDAVLFMDSDFPFDLSIINDSLTYINKFDLIVGSKFHALSKNLKDRKLSRNILSKISNTLVNILFRFKLKDTQCGYKLFTYKLAKIFAAKQTIDNFAFDIEYLYIAKLNNYKYIDIPIKLINENYTTVKILKDSFKCLFSILKIRLHKKRYINKN